MFVLTRARQRGREKKRTRECLGYEHQQESHNRWDTLQTSSLILQLIPHIVCFQTGTFVMCVFVLSVFFSASFPPAHLNLHILYVLFLCVRARPC